MNPEAGDGSGTLTSWLTSAVLNWLKLDWKSLLKCAECGCSPGSVASLSRMSPSRSVKIGEQRRQILDRRRQVVRVSCARAAGATTSMHTSSQRCGSTM